VTALNEWGNIPVQGMSGPRINTTKLRRRIEKYLAANSGGRKQTGETAFGIEACNEPQFVRRLRNGAAIGDALLSKVDEFLTARGF
jgi:hypothetical protein